MACRLTELPNEILSLIFAHICIPFDHDAWIVGSHPYFTVWWSTFEERPQLPHWRNIALVASHRLVCRSFDSIVSALLFRDLVIHIHPGIALSTIEYILKHAAEIATSISFYGYMDAPENSFNAQEAKSVIANCLGLFTKLKKLRLHNKHMAFDKRNWFQKKVKMPNLAVTHLSIEPWHMELSYSLISIGASLTTLEIYKWMQNSQRPVKLHLPKALPQLQELIIRAGEPPWRDVEKLISRTMIRDKASGSTRTPLRSLSLVDWMISGQINIWETGINRILTTSGIGPHLTALHILNDYDRADFRSCTNIQELYCTGWTLPVTLSHFPAKLRHLSLFCYEETDDLFNQFPDHINQELRSLSTLTLFCRAFDRRDIEDIQRAPEILAVGVDFSVVIDRWTQCKGVRLQFQPDP